MVAGPTAPPPRPSDRGASRSPAVAAVSPSGSTPRPLADTLADTLGIAAIVVIAAAGQLLHTLRDTRLPQDLGLYYQRLPALYGALGGDPAGASGIGAALLDVGGGYALTLAAAMRLLGRSPLLFDGIGIAWLIALLAAVAWCAWRAGGARAALAATALAAAFPMVFVHARTAWIHVPEAALVLAATAAWLGDPTLRRRGPRVVIALTGAAALALRPSAAVWLLPLAGAIGWRLRDVEGRWPRLAWALGPWLLGAAPLVHTIGPYLLAKLAARERYVEELPSLAGQLFVALGSLAGGLAAAAAIVGLRRPRPPAWGLWLGWIVAALALVVLFRAGVDNHTLAACALAVLAGCGVARLGRGAVAVPLACAALMHTPQWVPPPGPRRRRRPRAGLAGHRRAARRPQPLPDVRRRPRRRHPGADRRQL